MASKNLPEFAGWRDVQGADMGRGHLAGHQFTQRLIDVIRRDPESGKSHARQSLKQSMLDEFAGYYKGSRLYAAGAFQDDLMELVVFAARHGNFTAYFAEREAEAVHIARCMDEGALKAAEERADVQRKSKRAATRAISRAMHRAAP